MEQKWPRTRSRWTRSTLFSMPSVWLVEDRFNCEERCCYSACLKWCVSSISQQLLKIKPPRMRELLCLNMMRIINEPTVAEIHPPNAATEGIETQENTHSNHQKNKTTNAPTGSAKTSKKHKLHSEGAETLLWYHVKILRKTPQKPRTLLLFIILYIHLYTDVYPIHGV